MSRLDEECIVAVVRNRSGVDSGEIDYSIMSERFNKQNSRSLQEILETLVQLSEKVRHRLNAVRYKEETLFKSLKTDTGEPIDE